MILSVDSSTSFSLSNDLVLDAVVGASEDAIVLVAQNGLIKMWNPAAEAMLGYTPQEIIGTHIREILPQQLRELWAPRFELIRKGEVFRGVSTRLHKNGSLVDVFVSTQSVVTPNGDFAGYLIVLKDQKKKAQQELTNELLASIVRGAQEAIISTNINLEIRTWNATAERMFGRKEHEVLGATLDLIWPIALRAEAKKICDAVRSRRGHRFETTCVDANGREFPTGGFSSALLNTAGAPTGYTVFFSDLTATRKVEKTLRDTEEFSRKVLESSQDWISVIGMDGRIVYSNKSPEGADEGYFVGMDWLALWDNEEKAELSEALKEARYHGSASIKAKRKAPNNETVWYDLTMTLASIDHTSSAGRGMIISAHDITMQKRWDEHNHIIMRELSHRAKNLLAVVNGIVRSTAGHTKTISEFEEALSSRLRGLAKCHDLLVRQNWRGVALHSLVREQVDHFVCSEQSPLLITGPDIILPPETAQCLGMAIHELATNSIKYGALSLDQGRVQIACEPTTEGHELSWVESSGPKVGTPTRRGFGTEVIETMVSQTFRCDARIEFNEAGITWKCLIPKSGQSSWAL